MMDRPGSVRDPDGWTVGTLKQLIAAGNVAMERFLDSKFNDNEKLLNERYATQTKALDAAFSAASQAVTTALNAAAAASTKAEENAQQRFELFRVESGAQIRAVAEKLDEEKLRTDSRINDLTKRMDLNQGQGSGSDKSNAQFLAVGGVLIAGGGLLFKLIFP